MSLRSIFNHHYWGIPHHRPQDNRLIQTCYECGAERPLKIDLQVDLVSPATGQDEARVQKALGYSEEASHENEEVIN